MRASQARTARPSSGGPTRAQTAATRGRGPAAPPAPVVLDRYRLQRRLGAGAFGTVWLARDERLERDVAVKILARERIVGGRFEREARAAARLSHPGIVTLYEASVDDDGAYLVSELVRGSTLDTLLQDGRLSDRDILGIGVALCDALSHAHDEGVVHRDVKPSNVLVPMRAATPAQAAKLTDFGVARVVGSDSLTMTGDVIGTLAYMAPEQAEGLPAQAPADLYSLALVLYEALTGVNPVRITTGARHARRMGAHLPPLRRQRRDLPRVLGTGIDLALRPNPRERGRILDLRRALVSAHGEVGDEPGVVAEPWTTRMGQTLAPETGGPRQGTPVEPEEELWTPSPDRRRLRRSRRDRDDEPLESSAGLPAWPARGMAAAGAAATAGWLADHIMSPAPIPPLAAALLAAGLILLLPRLGWMALLVAAGAAAAAQGHGGYALLAAVALAVPIVLTPLRPSAWPLAAGAPALGLIGLAGAWPAVAATAGTAWRRAAIAAAGWIWLLVATPIAQRALYVALPGGTPPALGWSDSTSLTVRTVLEPIVNSGALAPAVLWALAAALAPWMVRGRSLAVDLLRTVMWSAVLVSAVPVAIAAAHPGSPSAAIRTAAVGAVLGGLLLLAPRWLTPLLERGRRRTRATGPGPHIP